MNVCTRGLAAPAGRLVKKRELAKRLETAGIAGEVDDEVTKLEGQIGACLDDLYVINLP